MTPAAIIEALTHRQGRIHLLDGDRLAVVPQSALDTTLRETIRREKRALVAYLRGEVGPAGTVIPAPSPRDHRDSCDETCDDAGDGSIGCKPLPPSDPTPPNNLLAEILDPDARAALLWWYGQGHPELADEESSVLRRLETLGEVPDERADLLRLVDRVRELRDAYCGRPTSR